MPRCAAFLRGMNLGRHRRISNAELVAAFEALGFTEVHTFRASGNVAFTSPRAAGDEALRREIEAGLGEALGYPVPTFVRGEAEVLGMGDERDLLAFGERELYWLPAGRMIESGLDLQEIERLVGPWTMRTKATVEQLASRYLAD